jgi:hypothetical protein
VQEGKIYTQKEGQREEQFAEYLPINVIRQGKEKGRSETNITTGAVRFTINEHNDRSSQVHNKG